MNTRKLSFVERYKVLENGCWEWQGYLNGEGYASYGGTSAHRYSYQQSVGPIPEGLVIDHLCRNRACVNPLHLEAIERGENIKRGDSGRRHGSSGMGPGECGVEWCIQPRANKTSTSKRTGELMTSYSKWCLRHAHLKYRFETPRKINSTYGPKA